MLSQPRSNLHPLLGLPALLFRKTFNMDRSCQQCHQARAKVRASHVPLTYVWSTLELTKSLLIVGKTLFLGHGAGCDFGSNLRCSHSRTQTGGSSNEAKTTGDNKCQEASKSAKSQEVTLTPKDDSTPSNRPAKVPASQKKPRSGEQNYHKQGM